MTDSMTICAPAHFSRPTMVSGATLVIARLDRLSRNAAVLLALWDSGVGLVAVDMPEANDLIRHGKHGLFNADNSLDRPSGTYRNQFWIEDSTLGRHYCRGVFGQMVMVAPDTGTIVVKLSGWPDFQDADLDRRTMAGMRAVERAFVH